MPFDGKQFVSVLYISGDLYIESYIEYIEFVLELHRVCIEFVLFVHRVTAKRC